MLENYEEALQDYSMAIERDSSDPDYYFNRALTQFYLDLNENACSNLEKAAQLGDEQAIQYFEEFCVDL